MSNRQVAAARVAVVINQAERAVDQAMSQTSLLVSELPDLQREAGLNAAWAQPAVASVCSALNDLTSARAALIEAHRSLSAVQRKLGVTTFESPNNDKPPENGPRLPVTGCAEVRPLRA